MLRPPQPAVYLFLLDVSRAALETGYLRTFCDSLIDELDKLPGDGRTQVAAWLPALCSLIIQRSKFIFDLGSCDPWKRIHS